MSVFTYELKKIMLFQKGLLYITAFLLISTLWLMVADTPQDSAMEQYRNEYEWYLEKVEGACTDEAAAFLEQEAAAIAEANSTQRDLLEQYYSGAITEEQYEQKSAALDAITENENGFEVVYQQYLYVCENKDNHYFLQTNGWSGLFSNSTLDFPLFLVVLLLAAAVFCSEYSCQMDALILTSKEGLKSTRYKLLIIVASVLSLCLLTALIRYAFFAIKYGLPCGDYPIQSIADFGTSMKELSLLEGYIAITAFRCFGYVSFSVLLLLASVLVKKYALTVLLGAVTTLVPYIGLSATTLCRLPIPLAFMLGTDYLSGSIKASDPLTGEEIAVFQEVSGYELTVLLVVSVLISLLAVLWLLMRNKNRWQGIGGKSKRYCSAVLCLAITLLFTGCSDGDAANISFNAASTGSANEYEVICDHAEQAYYLKNNTTGVTLDLVRSPLFGVFSGEDNVKGYYMDYPDLYYTISETERHINRVGTYNSSFTKVSVVKLNLETFKEEIIFEKITDSGRSLLGIEYEVGDTWEFLQYHHSFFVNENSIFFIGNGGITEVDRKSGIPQKLDLRASENIAFDGRYFYYIGNRSVLTKYDTQLGSTMPLAEVTAYDFCLDGQSIYYISMTDGYRVFQCSLDGENCKMVADITAIDVSCDEASIYIIHKGTGEETIVKK